VEEYTERQLTVPSDRLPALSALALKFQGAVPFPPGSYLAGLWRPELMHGLAWQCAPEGFGIGSLPPTYRAPSWASSSIEAPIYYGNTRLNKLQVETFIESASTNVGGNVFGEVSSGWLLISGRAASADFSLPSWKPTEGQTYNRRDVEIRWSKGPRAVRRHAECYSFSANVPLVGRTICESPIRAQKTLKDHI
jgi:hypothetical protein